jgi:prepilin-type processing-associated H-X9-DG protein
LSATAMRSLEMRHEGVVNALFAGGSAVRELAGHAPHKCVACVW